MAVALSDATEQRLARLFRGEELAEARGLLEQDCAEGTVWSAGVNPEGLERVRFAVLKLSGGTLSGLVDAIVEAQTDWRDVLVAAGFADDVKAHESWWPE